MLLTLCTKMHANHFKHIITARKRSLGQGNVFTPVCQSFCSQGGGGRAWQGVGMHGREWACMAGGACMTGGVHGRGHLWQGIRVWQRVCVVGACVQERRPLKRALRILLECILVINNFAFLCIKCIKESTHTNILNFVSFSFRCRYITQ